jgi:photosystem II protein
MAASVMASLNLKPSPFTVEKSSVRGLPTLSRRSFKIEASGVKKIKTDTPYGLLLPPRITYIYITHTLFI